MVDMNVNEIVFDVSKYNDIDDMMSEVSKTMQILMKNDYVMTFRYDGCDYYVLEYANDERINPLGVPNPRWINEDEWYAISEWRKDIEADDDEDW